MLIETAIGVLLFVAGYSLGRTNYLYSKIFKNEKESFGDVFQRKSNKANRIKSIKIDEKKFVTDVSTSSFLKNYEKIGKETISEGGVIDAVTKLKKLKGK